jgi:hypothetical protein
VCAIFRSENPKGTDSVGSCTYNGGHVRRSVIDAAEKAYSPKNEVTCVRYISHLCSEQFSISGVQYG